MSSLSKTYSFYRAPLSSINSNAQQEYLSSSCDLKKSGYVRRLSSATSVSSSTTSLSQYNDTSTNTSRIGPVSHPSRQCSTNSTAVREVEYNRPFFKFHPAHVLDVFRKREQPVDSPALELARAIRDIHHSTSESREMENQSQRQQKITLDVFEEDTVYNLIDLMPADVESFLMDEPKQTRQFLEPPNEDIFSEEMEELLTLKLSTPFYESDSETDLSEEEEELSIATSVE